MALGAEYVALTILIDRERTRTYRRISSVGYSVLLERRSHPHNRDDAKVVDSIDIDHIARR